VDGAKVVTAKVGQPVSITAIVTDDGIPKPPMSANPLAALFGGRSAAAGEGGRGGASNAPAPGPGLSPALLKVLSGQATPEEKAAAADSLGVSLTQLDALIAARRHPEMNPPARITVGKTTGLHLSWFVYRGAGKVTFSPEQTKTWEDTRAGMNSPWAPLWTPPKMPADGKMVVQATFVEAGTYVLKALADDGALLGEDTVTVIVNP
jgi:hypothetical protein